MDKQLAGRCLLTLNAVGIAIGGFVADMNATHIYNPHWPPHAKFHDGQTMAFGVFLSLATLFFTWRRAGDRQTNVLAAALFGGVLYWAQAAANLFPGVTWIDPEFLKAGESLTDFPPQLYIDLGMSAVIILATWLAWPRKPTTRRP
ncbi:acetyltransferase [Sphingomonas gei]|uniref:Acetyltransferase n=1 Tax=Sphingomonas gei TaxID=1395960 RepID=A0A4S1WZU3_9SPHN|nr:DUF6640 family protein [Sphingomonas gei]TGX49121.1 acetyltransferase [Sphingomonas gei]